MLNLTDQEFDQMVEEAIKAITPEFRAYFDTVPVIVEDQPDARLCRDMQLDDPGELLGLFHGIPFDCRSVQGMDGPNLIVLYRRNLLSYCRSRRKLLEQIRRTLVHELAHLVGFSEEEIRRRGY